MRVKKQHTQGFGKLLRVVSSLLLMGGAAWGAADDSAGNYTAAPNTFTNGANAGSGFGPWEITLGDAAARVELLSSTAGSGDINSANGLSFCFFGGASGSYAEAVRAFGSALGAGDEFSCRIAYNWNGGARGLNILAADNSQLFNLNYGGANSLTYTFGGPGIEIANDYVATAVVEVVVRQLAGNQLQVTLTRNDGLTTNVTSTGLTLPAAKVKAYNGGHDASSTNHALFVNDLVITDSTAPVLGMSGRTGMPVIWTNAVTVTRNGSLAGSLLVNLSSDSAAISIPGSVTIPAGTNAASFELAGVTRGHATVTATATDFPTATLSVAVFDVAYDDSSYNSVFTNGVNAGAGFQAWILAGNGGPGEGFTNHAGSFIGNSTQSGGGNVNAQPSGDAFGIYANKEGTGGDAPTFNATRAFDALALAGTLSVDFGVMYRNGYKGVMIQNGDTQLFQVEVGNDDYYYKNVGGGDTQTTSLGWTQYDANTAIRVELTRKTASTYDISIIRSGTYTATNTLTGVNIGGTPERVRFYVYDTQGGGENNLYFNRLGISDGEIPPELSVAGREGMVVDQTNELRVTRNGSASAQLEVTLASADPSILTVTPSITMNVGETSAVASVVGVGRGACPITVTATGYDSIETTVSVHNVAYDSSSYYEPGTWTNEANGGIGFTAWVFTNNAGAGEGFTNYAGAFLGDSTEYSGGNVNGLMGNAFGIYANQAGTGGSPFFNATRQFPAPLPLGQQVSFDMGVNHRNGAKGVMIQSGDTWLLEIGVQDDQYVYCNHSAGWPPLPLGWSEYSPNTSIQVEMTRVTEDQYTIDITRSGEYSGFTRLEAIPLKAVPDRVRYFVWNTQNSGENNLYVNRLGLDQYSVLTMEGRVNIDIEGTTTIYIARSGPTNDALTVQLSSASASVVTVPPTVEIPAGETMASFEAVGHSESLVNIYASATEYVAAPFLVNVFAFPAEWDNAGNYLPGGLLAPTFTNGANAGAGFSPWQFAAVGDGGFYALRAAGQYTAWIDSMNNRSFCLMGDTNGAYAEAVRQFTAMAEGDEFEVVLAMNWDGGNRGVDLQDANSNMLFNFNLSNPNNFSVTWAGGSAINLGWEYSSTAAVKIVARQIAGHQLSVTLRRENGLETNLVSTGLATPVAQFKLYNGGHAADDMKLALFANDLLITRGGGYTDGIPNAWWNKYSIPEGERLAASDYDNDDAPNGDEYAGDTNPADATQSFRNQIRTATGTSLLTMQIGPNTTNSRTYDVWWSTDLLATPQTWTPFGFNAKADAGGGPIQITVTNDAGWRFYRTGVITP